MLASLQNSQDDTSIKLSAFRRFVIGNRIALLTEGKIRMVGTPDEMRDSQDPAVRRFLERDFGTPVVT